MKYKLLFETCKHYEVEAENEDEALKQPVPQTGHRASITVLGGTCYKCNKLGMVKQGNDWSCNDHVRFG